MLEGWPGEQLCIKIWETIADKGIGSLLRPWHLRRDTQARAEAERYQRLSIAQVEQEVETIRRGLKSFGADGVLRDTRQLTHVEHSEVELSQPAEPSVLVPESTRILGEQDRLHTLERQLNLEKIVLLAGEEALHFSDTPPSDQSVDGDWFSRWRENAEGVTSEEMQRLWARVLAGEIHSPGRYSLHTVEFLRRLAKSDAELISKIAGYVIIGALPRLPEFYETKGIKLAELIELEGLGLLIGAQGGFTSTLNSLEKNKLSIRIKVGQYMVSVSSDDKIPDVKMKIYMLTKVGREVITLGKFAPEKEFAIAFAQSFKNPRVKVFVGDWQEVGIEGRGVITNEVEV